jgi:hypothetical protein
MKFYQRLFSFFTGGWLVILFLAACEKGDQLAPVIEFELPVPYTFFSVGDTVRVKARVRDESAIKHVEVNFLGSGNTSSGPVFPVITDPRDFTFEVELVITNLYLASGEFYVNIWARDSQNTSSKSQKVFIAELPLEREKLSWLCKTGPTVNAYGFPWSGSPQLIQSIPGDYSGSGVNSRYGQLHVAGRVEGSYSAIDLNSNQVLWDFPANNSTSLPYFNGMTSGKTQSYVSFYEGFIKGYDEYGAQKFTGAVLEEYSARKLVESQDRLYAYLENKIPITKRMTVYNTRTGAVVREVSVGGAIVEFLPRSGYDVIVLWNEGGQGQLRVFDYYQNAFFQPRSLPPGQIIAACQISPDTYALAMTSGIQFYRYSTNSITPLVAGVQAQALVYEKIGNEIIAAVGNQVRAFNAQSGLPLYSFTAPDSVLAVHVQYNK